MLVPPKIFSIVSHADTDSSRYALGGLRLTRNADGQPLAIACDGRRLIVATWPEADGKLYPAGVVDCLDHKADFVTIIPKADALTAGRVKIKSPKPILTNVAIDEVNSNGRVAIGATDLDKFHRFDCKSIEGKFPKWEDVFPNYTGDNSLSITIGAKFLSEAADALAKVTLADDEKKSVTLTVSKTETAARPMMLTADRNGFRAAAIIMPLTQDSVERGKPAVSFAEWHPVTGKTDSDLRAEFETAEAAREAADDCSFSETKVSIAELNALRNEVKQADANTADACEQLRNATETAKRAIDERDKLRERVEWANQQKAEAEKLAASYAADQRKLGGLTAENEQLRSKVDGLQAAFNEAERRRELAESIIAAGPAATRSQPVTVAADVTASPIATAADDTPAVAVDDMPPAASRAELTAAFGAGMAGASGASLRKPRAKRAAKPRNIMAAARGCYWA